ncbi:hypothetical protein MOBT1_003158 [Malassezia obtusa]|uniref:Dynactin subunit 4 n=1 Tax=Malassezia obtusa TaxID=76774 RepID=A0AAF0E191_9BASI|nr:hypothetical protein MOBT1_003158 [Malassezia obtusa]
MATYQCSCAYDDLRTARQRADVPAAWPAVTQPGVPLSALYFCEDCYELRCNDCVAWDVSSCYCPHCLYEVPSTSVQAQKAQCARSCFTCPECAHLLSIHGSDPPRQGVALTSPEASQGVPPFFFACTSCLWDSKRIGIAADKPGELNGTPLPHTAIMPSATEPTPEQRVFDELGAHLAQLVRPPAPPTPSVPRVLADLPALPARYWQGKPAPSPAAPDELPAPELHTTRAQQKQAAREARRAEYVARQRTPDGSGALVRLAQRYAMPLEQPYETSALRPQRVRLLAKLSKRCAECRHILVRPELRTSSSRYKLRLLAKEFLPSLRVVRRTDDGAHVTVTNPLMDAMDVALYTPDAELSAMRLSLAGATDAWDVPPPPPPPDADLFAAGMHTHQNTATIGVRAAAPVALRVQWTVAERSHTFWACLPM